MWRILLRVQALALVVGAVVLPRQSSFFYKGHDLSSLALLEQTGSIYKDTSKQNQTRTADAILGDGGMNSVRLRLWVNPKDFESQPPNYNIDYTINLASRFYKAGYKIYLDYHFSDTWADPQKQYIPKAWPTTLQPLASTLRSYVSSTLASFHSAGIPLSIVSLGNEIRKGMLWPVGKVDPGITPQSALVANYTNLATLIKAARQGVDDAVSAGLQKPDVMIRAFPDPFFEQSHLMMSSQISIMAGMSICRRLGLAPLLVRALSLPRTGTSSASPSTRSMARPRRGRTC